MKWYSDYLGVYGKKPGEISDGVFSRIRDNVSALSSQNPLVTVSVIAYNEECHLTSCLWSLSEQKCSYPMEIIGVNNDSADNTAEVFEKCGVRCFLETRHSPGWARLKGMENSAGRFHLFIDGDSVYPPHYVQTMVSTLLKKNTVAVGGSYSNLPDKRVSPVGLFLYELVRDFYMWLIHFQRPELAARGSVFGFVTELGRQVGIRTDLKRGEDGSLAFGLKKYGRIRFIRSRKARSLTEYLPLDKGETLSGHFIKIFRMRIKSLPSRFVRKDHYDDGADNLVNNSN